MGGLEKEGATRVRCDLREHLIGAAGLDGLLSDRCRLRQRRPQDAGEREEQVALEGQKLVETSWRIVILSAKFLL